MKKMAVLFSVFAFLFSANAGNCITPPEKTPAAVSAQTYAAVAAKDTKKDWKSDEMYVNLNFDETQMKDAKEIRVKYESRIVPLYVQIGDKKREITAIERSRLAPKEQKRRISAAQKEIKVLRKEVKKIKKESGKEFDALLTEEQKVSYKKACSCSCSGNCPQDCPNNCPCKKESRFKQINFKQSKGCPTCITNGCSSDCNVNCIQNCSENCPCEKEHKVSSNTCSKEGCPLANEEEMSKGKGHSKLCPLGCPKGCPDNCDDTCRCKKRSNAKKPMPTKEEEAVK